MNGAIRKTLLILAIAAAAAATARPQTVSHLNGFSRESAIPGYETPLTDKIRSQFAELSSKTDNVGNLDFHRWQRRAPPPACYRHRPSWLHRQRHHVRRFLARAKAAAGSAERRFRQIALCAARLGDNARKETYQRRVWGSERAFATGPAECPQDGFPRGNVRGYWRDEFQRSVGGRRGRSGSGGLERGARASGRKPQRGGRIRRGRPVRGDGAFGTAGKVQDEEANGHDYDCLSRARMDRWTRIEPPAGRTATEGDDLPRPDIAGSGERFFTLEPPLLGSGVLLAVKDADGAAGGISSGDQRLGSEAKRSAHVARWCATFHGRVRQAECIAGSICRVGCCDALAGDADRDSFDERSKRSHAASRGNISDSPVQRQRLVPVAPRALGSHHLP